MPYFFAVIIALMPLPAHAFRIAEDTGWSCQGFVGCGSNMSVVTYLVGRLLMAVAAFMFFLTLAAFLYGALRMIVSQGEEGKEAGKKALMYAAFGLVCALLVSMIFRFLCGYVYTLGGSGVGVCGSWWVSG